MWTKISFLNNAKWLTLYKILSWKSVKSVLYYSQGKGDTDEQVKTWRQRKENQKSFQKPLSNTISIKNQKIILN